MKLVHEQLQSNYVQAAVPLCPDIRYSSFFFFFFYNSLSHSAVQERAQAGL